MQKAYFGFFPSFVPGGYSVILDTFFFIVPSGPHNSRSICTTWTIRGDMELQHQCRSGLKCGFGMTRQGVIMHSGFPTSYLVIIPQKGSYGINMPPKPLSEGLSLWRPRLSCFRDMLAVMEHLRAAGNWTGSSLREHLRHVMTLQGGNGAIQAIVGITQALTIKHKQ